MVQFALKEEGEIRTREGDKTMERSRRTRERAGEGQKKKEAEVSEPDRNSRLICQ